MARLAVAERNAILEDCKTYYEKMHPGMGFTILLTTEADPGTVEIDLATNIEMDAAMQVMAHIVKRYNAGTLAPMKPTAEASA